MSFFGKQFKKVQVENAAEVLGKLELPESTLALLRNPDSITTFTQNPDGTIHYTVKDSTGKQFLNEKFILKEYSDFKTPDGMNTRVKFELEGDDVLKSHMHLPGEKVVHMDRHFEANGMKMYMSLKGTDLKATIHYEVV